MAAVNSPWRQKSIKEFSKGKQEAVSLMEGIQRRQKEAVAFLEGEEVGVDFFADGKFEEKLDLVAEKLRNHQVFMDMIREGLSSNADGSLKWEMTIGGKTIDLSGCPSDSYKAATKFFLQKLKESGLSAEVAFKALKSLCRYAFIQGEATRPATALMGSMSDTEKNTFATYVYAHTILVDSQTKFEFTNTGDLENIINVHNR
jgi:hypothetical protein